MVESFDPIPKSASDDFAGGGAKCILVIDGAGVFKRSNVIVGEDDS